MRNNRVIQWVEGQTTGTLLYGGNGQGSNANQLNYPHDIGSDSSGAIYVLDSGNYRVQKYSDSSGNGTTVVGGNGNGSGLNQIGFSMGFHVTVSGEIYIADRNNQRIVKWTPGTNQGEVVLSSDSGFGSIYPMDVLEAGGYLYFTDIDNHRVVRYKITD
jgi:sugar lactone lactonase YvrE